MPLAGRPDLTGDPLSVDLPVDLSGDLSVEVDPADALERTRDLVDDDVDPEQAVVGPGLGSASTVDADEGDLAEQQADVVDDDEYDADR